METKDVVRIEVRGETHTGVVKKVNDGVVDIKLRRGAVEQEFENDELWACNDQALIVEDKVEVLGSPDTSSIHPQNFKVDSHLKAL